MRRFSQFLNGKLRWPRSDCSSDWTEAEAAVARPERGKSVPDPQPRRRNTRDSGTKARAAVSGGHGTTVLNASPYKTSPPMLIAAMLSADHLGSAPAAVKFCREHALIISPVPFPVQHVRDRRPRVARGLWHAGHGSASRIAPAASCAGNR